jgi:hypothetical protein
LDAEREPLHFINTPYFSRGADQLLDDDDIRELQQILNENPRAGDLVQGTGGVRKLRVAASGRGKRGGGRVLYLYVEVRLRVYFLAVFAKNDQPDFTPAYYRALKALVQQLKMES